MREVLAFGDSLTWGDSPLFGGPRHPIAQRWPMVLEGGLQGVRVHADGVRGRCTTHDPGTSPADLNGALALPTLLFAHAPLDAVIILLGTNDLLQDRSDSQIASGVTRLAEIVVSTPLRTAGPAPRLLLVAPPPVQALPGGFATPDQAARSQAFAQIVAGVAQAADCAWLDAGTVCTGGAPDGVHLSADDTAALGAALVDPVRRLLR